MNTVLSEDPALECCLKSLKYLTDWVYVIVKAKAFYLYPHFYPHQTIR